MLSRTEWIVNVSRFMELSASWEALLPAPVHPFDLHDWYAAWWRSFGGTGKLAVCALEREGRLAAVVPLFASGSRLHALANDHSGMFRPLAVDEDSGREAIGAVLDRAPSELATPMVPADDPSLPALEAGARERSMPFVAEPGPVSPLLDTSGDLERWRKQEHPGWKSRLARYRRKMEREHEASIEVVGVPDDLETWLEEGFQIEASGWKGRAGTAIDSAADTSGFYRDVAHRFMARGELRLSRIKLDGRPVAFSFCLLGGDRLYSLKTGYDEAWKRLSPGLVLQLAIAERCFEMGLDAYELLGETSYWKRRLAGDSREHVNMRVFSRSVPGLSRYAYRSVLRPRLKRAYRRVRPVAAGRRA